MIIVREICNENAFVASVGIIIVGQKWFSTHTFESSTGITLTIYIKRERFIRGNSSLQIRYRQMTDMTEADFKKSDSMSLREISWNSDTLKESIFVSFS